MFSFDKKQVTIPFKYLGGHPELPKQRALTVFRIDNDVCFKEVLQPTIPIRAIKKITLRKLDTNSGTPKSGTEPLPDRYKKLKNALVVTVDYNGLDVHLLFTGDSMTAKYVQFMGLIKGYYKHYEHNEVTSS